MVSLHKLEVHAELTSLLSSSVLRSQVRRCISLQCTLHPENQAPISPGCMSAEVGHHFANPTNHFWKCLHRSRTSTLCLRP